MSTTTTLFIQSVGVYFTDVPVISGILSAGEYIIVDTSAKRFFTENFPFGLSDRLVARMKTDDLAIV